jgi:hypothetical protein
MAVRIPAVPAMGPGPRVITSELLGNANKSAGPPPKS